MAETTRIYWPPSPILPAGSTSTGHASTASAAEKKPSFAEVLAKEESRVSFSQHALQRMQDRQIDFSRQDLTKLDDTVERMAQKGAKESLIYLNDVALIVSVANKTVITAMDGPSAKENIFTNIDSAAIL